MERRGFLTLAGTAALAPGAAGPASDAPSAGGRPASEARQAHAPADGGRGRPRGAGLGELRVRRHRDRAGGGPGLRPRAAARRARARPARLPGREGRGPRGRRQPFLRRPLGEGYPRHPGRLGLRTRPPPPRLGRHPEEPQGRRGLQRHHRPALRPAGEGRPRDLPRARRAQLVARLLCRSLPPGGVRGRGRHDGQPAGNRGSARPAREPHPHDHPGQGAGPPRRRQPDRPHRARGLSLRAVVRRGDPLPRGRRRRRSTGWIG